MKISIHSDFKLNGKSFSTVELIGEANYLVKQGTFFEKGIGHFLLEWLNDEENIFLQTSGSTGIPKKIYVSKSAMEASAKATGEFFNLKPGNTALLCLSAEYIAGKMMLVRAMVLGLSLDYVEPNSNPLDGNTSNYDFLALVPLQVAASIPFLNRIKYLIIGGAKLNVQLIQQLEDVSTAIYETYGMTETVSHIALKRLGEPYFTLLPSIEISLDNRGCLVIHAPSLYTEPIVTNDVVDLVSANQFKLKGRVDNIINSGGIKIYPEALEEQLSAFISRRFFFTSEPNAILGEQLILIIEGDAFEVPASFFAKFSKFQLPKKIYFISDFVETPTKKINRALTKALLKR